MSRKPFIRTFVSQEPKVQKTFSERNMFVVWPHRCRHKLSIFLRCIGTSANFCDFNCSFENKETSTLSFTAAEAYFSYK